MIRPWRARWPGETLLASDWNEVQRQHRLALRAHEHTGGPDGATLDGAAFDPDSTLSVACLDVSTLWVDGEDWSPLAQGLPPRHGALAPGRSLTVQGDLRVEGAIRLGGDPTPGAAPLRAWGTLVGTTWTTRPALTLAPSRLALFLVELRAVGVASAATTLTLTADGLPVATAALAAGGATVQVTATMTLRAGPAGVALAVLTSGDAKLTVELRATALWGGGDG